MKTPLAALVLTGSFVATAAAGGDPPPDVPKEIQPVYCLVGTWTSKDASGTIAGVKHKVDLTIICAPTAGGLGILCNSVFDIAGLGRVQETDLFGYDAGQQRYHWFSVTQQGETHDHVALPPGPTDKAITFAYSGYQGGKPMQEVITMSFLDEAVTRIGFRNDGVIDGKPAWRLAATLIKK